MKQSHDPGRFSPSPRRARKPLGWRGQGWAFFHDTARTPADSVPAFFGRRCFKWTQANPGRFPTAATRNLHRFIVLKQVLLETISWTNLTSANRVTRRLCEDARRCLTISTSASQSVARWQAYPQNIGYLKQKLVTANSTSFFGLQSVGGFRGIAAG